MADNKKYYYLKLKDNFFDTDEMIILESMQDGYIYSNILLKLYLRSLKNDGKLMLNDKIPFNSTMLSQVTRVNVGTIEKAVQIFKDLGLIDVLDNGAIFMTEIQNFIGNSSSEADRKRIYRNKIDNEKGHLSLECPDKNPPEIELKKEIELDTPKEHKNKQKTSKGCRLENLPKPEKEDLYNYMKDYCNTNLIQIIEIEKFKDYWLAETTTKAIKKDWKATFRNWCRSDWIKKVKEEKIGNILCDEWGNPL